MLAASADLQTLHSRRERSSATRDNSITIDINFKSSFGDGKV